MINAGEQNQSSVIPQEMQMSELEKQIADLQNRLNGIVAELERSRNHDRRKTWFCMLAFLICAALVSAGVVLAVPAGTGTQGPLTVAVPFKVVNQRGEVILAVNEKETDVFQNQLILMDRDGRAKMQLSPDDPSGQPVLLIRTAEGQPAILLGSRQGTGDLQVYEPDTKSHFMIGPSAQFSGVAVGVYSSGTNEKPIIGIGELNGQGLIEVKKAGEDTWAGLGIEKNGFPAFKIKEDGKELANLGVSEPLKAALRIYGPGGNTVAAIGHGLDHPGGLLQIFSDSFERSVEIHDSEGGGQVLVLPHSDTADAVIAATSNGGVVEVANNSGPVASVLKVSESKGGSLELNDTAGAPAVEAGWTGSGGEICAATAKRGRQCIDISLPLQMR